ncbi:MAG: hypothetical protein HY683_05690 [Chloroflexi bacterium]|nr:hypothetical protein [Chloroflexota bacterium]
MKTTAPVAVTVDLLKALLDLARSPKAFLSLYIVTEPSQATSEGVRLRAAAMLDQVAADLRGSPLEKPFRAEREHVEDYLRSLGPGGPGLAVLCSTAAGEWHALWLPDRPSEHARFGPGAYMLPLVEVSDEWEPVGLAEVHRDKARLMVFAAGRTEEVQHFETEVPGKHKAGGGMGTRYRPGIQTYGAQHTSGGGAGARFERHIQTHAEQHLKGVLQELENVHQRYGLRRLFLAGPTETLALFRPMLSRDLRSKVAGEISFDARSGDAEVRAQVLRASREAERQEEQKLVSELITRSQKDQLAVVGVPATLWALNRREANLLVITDGSPPEGRRCLSCNALFPQEDVMCPQCGVRTVKVNLWEELPGSAQVCGAALEVVHGPAAKDLWQYGGIGALLRPS